MVESLKKEIKEFFINSISVNYEDLIKFEIMKGQYYPSFYDINKTAFAFSSFDKVIDFYYKTLERLEKYYNHPSPIIYSLNINKIIREETQYINQLNYYLALIDLHYNNEMPPLNEVFKQVNLSFNSFNTCENNTLISKLKLLLNKLRDASLLITDDSLYLNSIYSTLSTENFSPKRENYTEILNNVVYLIANDDGPLELDNQIDHFIDLFITFWRGLKFLLDTTSVKTNAMYYIENPTNIINIKTYFDSRKNIINENIRQFVNSIDYDLYSDEKSVLILDMMHDISSVSQFENFKGSEHIRGTLLLESLIGLKNVKDQIRKIISFYKNNNNNLNISLNMCFYGNPGTGKTEVARILGTLFFEEKILPCNKLIEVSRGDLIGEYVGQTAIKVNDVFNSALGGVLFIDEAYSLFSDDSYSREAISTLIKLMEDYRGKICVILAGYNADMKKMIQSNEGFKSRIQFEIEFDNFSRDELRKIIFVFLFKYNYRINCNAVERILDILDYKRKEPEFGNAREVRKIITELMLYAEDSNEFKLKNFISTQNVEKFINNNKLRIVSNPQKKMISASEELESLVGLENVKISIKKIKATIIKNKNILNDNFNLHMCFYGNPGTGKTMVANLMSRILFECGVLSEAKFYSASASDLISSYVGDTVNKTKKIIEKSVGGVLFIDEAYSLAMNPYGLEAIAILLQAMENERGRFCLILAGYPKEMKEFLNTNPGFRSRIQFHIYFDDYTVDELLRIEALIFKSKKYSVEESAIEFSKKIISYLTKQKNFSNARTIRNMVEQVIMNQNLRTKGNLEDRLINLEDFKRYTLDQNIKLPIKKVSNDDYKDDILDFYNSQNLECNYTNYEFSIISIYDDIHQGTGFIISNRGLALTCYHCIGDLNNYNARIRIMTYDEEVIDLNCTFVVLKVDKNNDIALIKLNSSLKKYRFIKIFNRNEYDYKPLSKFYMLGYPFGGEIFKNVSYTFGTIASINKIGNRNVVFADMFGKPGNSGSPIIDETSNKVIGIFWGSLQKDGQEINCFTAINEIWNLIEGVE